MSNILKSTKLDIALVKPYFKTICFTLLLPIVFAAINRSLLTGVSFAMCFIAMTTGYTFSITEKNSMDRLFGILPVRKSELVIGRYVFVLKNPRQVLTRGQLLEKLWDIDERFVDEHTLTTSISRIRSKIESDGGAPYIKTVYGMGYQWTGGEVK